MFKEWIQVTATRDGFRDYRAQVGNIESALSGFVEPAAETARNRWQWSVGTIDGPYFGRIGEAYSEERAKAEACEAAADVKRQAADHDSGPWVVVWDNGASACGTFPFTFTSYEAADDYGRDWALESNIRDGIDPEGDEEGYSYEVVKRQ